jgi:hypothetical protein
MSGHPDKRAENHGRGHLICNVLALVPALHVDAGGTELGRAFSGRAAQLTAARPRCPAKVEGIERLFEKILEIPAFFG